MCVSLLYRIRHRIERRTHPDRRRARASVPNCYTRNHMRRIATSIAATALIATASCGDNPSPGATAPTASNSSAMRAFGELSAAGHAPFTYSFNISSRGGSYLLGQYLLTVPANAVCDPSTSNYGPQSWD